MLEVGRIGRAHGVRGTVHVTLSTDRTERLDEGARLFDGHDWLVVDWSRSQPPAGAQHSKWLVHFVGVDDRVAAERLTGRPLSADPIADPDALWIHDLIGSRVVDQTGVERGICVAVIDNPAHDLLELDTGHLVPVTFIIDSTGGITRVDTPDGLFDLE